MGQGRGVLRLLGSFMKEYGNPISLWGRVHVICVMVVAGRLEVLKTWPPRKFGVIFQVEETDCLPGSQKPRAETNGGWEPVEGGWLGGRYWWIGAWGGGGDARSKFRPP